MRHFALLFILPFGLAAALFCVLLIAPLESAPSPPAKGDYAITHVSVIDTVGGKILPDMTVLIQDGRIIDILASAAYPGQIHVTEIPAAGKYLVPGFWDMHTHGLKLSPQIHHPLFIRYGVTSVRDMSGCLSEDDSYWACPDDRRLWEAEALSGARVSPRYPLQSSYQTNGGNEVPDAFPGFFRVASEDDAQRLVRFYKSEGVDFIKIYTELTKQQYEYVAKYAEQENVGIAGHKPIAVSLKQAIETGFSSIEHGRLFAFECYRGIEAFRRLEAPLSHYDAGFIRKILDSQDQRQCEKSMQLMSQQSVWWVPTMTTLKMSARAGDQRFREDPRLRYIPYVVRKLLWEPDIDRAAVKGYDPQGRFVHADFYSLAENHLQRAHESGVPLMSGTDNIDTYVFTGSSLHDELGYFVAAGLTPLEALRTATILPATFAGLVAEYGSIETGKHADLVLLNSNPLVDIKNTTDIHAVFFDGRYFPAKALTNLEKYATEMAGSLRVNIRFVYDLLASPLMRKQLAD